MTTQNRKSKNVTLRARQFRMVILLAEMRSPQEVADIIEKEFSVTMDRREVYSFSKRLKWSKVIRYSKKRFLADLVKIPIANKAIRLKYLQTVYKEALTESLKSRSQFGDVWELKLGAAISAVQAAHEEVEGKGLKIHVDKGGKVVFQDIKIEGKAIGELLGDINNRLSSQFTKE